MTLQEERKANAVEALEAQMEVVGIFAAALGMTKNQTGAEVDICWRLERAISQHQARETLQYNPGLGG